MNRTDAPKKQPIAFGVNGPREDLPNTTPSGDNTASYNSGFPPITMILKSAGGLPPKGQDMNQILYELSNLAKWGSAGALNTYDSSFATAISGYPSGSMIISDDNLDIFICETDGNTNNPNLDMTGWKSLLSFLGMNKSRFAVATSSQTITIPDWVTEIYVTASAGGGGGGGSGGSTNLTGTGAGGQGGGAGEFVVRKKFTVTPGSTINVTIGAGGTGGISGTPSINGGNGAAGGGTVVGSLLTLNGGGGGHGGDSFMGSALPGGGAGGTGYPAGQDGQDGANTILGNGCGGNGGNSFFGGGAGGSRAGSAGVDGKDAYGYGSGGSGAGGGYGGSGGGSNGGVGGKGSSGIVIIEW